MDSHTLDLILTTVVLSFWILFPIGMYLAVAHIDKLREEVKPEVAVAKKTPRKNPGISRRPTLIPH